ncbi:MAG: galactose-1-phosphate uridylyltransferase [Candidatus Riflebacteria bacterium]|nr:galactose-1-phosphate uridylyltransferase [Candidatus Riflebacteria bacterium]
MPELRKDPVTGAWVIFSPERSRRPQDFACFHSEETPKESCPFCPENEAMTSGLEVLRCPPTGPYGAHPWSIRVLQDKYPILSRRETFHRFGEGMYDLMSGYGHHELVVETPLHGETFREYDDFHIRELLSVLQNRSAELSVSPKIKQILITRSWGAESGAQISHSHSHIVALPIVPKRIFEEIQGSQGYYRFKDRCVYCDIIVQEREDASRLVLENDSFVAFCAWAARFPFEVTIAPRVHLSRFETIRPNEITLLADIMKGVISSIEGCLPRPALNLMFHTSPTPQARTQELADVARHYHWHLELVPKMTRIAGFEWGSGFFINPVLPEDSARYLRDWIDAQKSQRPAFPLSRTRPDLVHQHPRRNHLAREGAPAPAADSDVPGGTQDPPSGH